MNFHRFVQLFCIVALEKFILRMVLANENNLAKFTKIDCLPVDPEYLVNVTCRVKPVRRDLYLLNLQGIFIQPADRLMARIRLFKKAFSFQPFLIDVSENLCDFLSNKHKSTYMKILSGIYLPYTNMNYSCPLTGVITFKDMPLDAKILPSVWPTGEYRIDITVLRIEKLVIALQINFAVEEKLSNRNGPFTIFKIN